MDAFHTVDPWQEDYKFMAAAVLLKDRYGCISIHFRDDFDHVFAHGKWGYFAGAVEPGETIVHDAVRALHEETGIVALESEMQPLARVFSGTGEGAHHYVYMLDRVIKPSEIALNEGAGFAFIHQGQLDKCDLVPATKHILSSYFAQYGG